MTNYPVAEAFFSVQGEGLHMGRSAYFIRLYGCNVKCPWCDSKPAWQGGAADIVSAESLAETVGKSGAEIAVITGGEPCLHNLEPLLAELSAKKIPAHLETSGTLEIREKPGAEFAWVALSPKLFSMPSDAALERADELKFIVSNAGELGEYHALTAKAKNAKAVWLHPEWSKSSDKELLGALCEFVKAKGFPYRVGWQMHKNYFAR